MITKYKNILVAIDGSNQSENAFLEAVEIASRNNASIYIAWIIDDLNLAANAYYFAKLVREEQERTKKYINIKIEYAKSQGISDVQSVIEIGSPKRMLGIDLPNEYDINLIVIGATGKNAIAQTIIGSTTAFVVNQSNCNVLVVK